MALGRNMGMLSGDPRGALDPNMYYQRGQALGQQMGQSLGMLAGRDMRTGEQVAAAQEDELKKQQTAMFGEALASKDPDVMRVAADKLSKLGDRAGAVELIAEANRIEDIDTNKDPFAHIVVVGNYVYNKKTGEFKTAASKDDVKDLPKASVSDVRQMIKEGLVTPESGNKWMKSKDDADLVFTQGGGAKGEEARVSYENRRYDLIKTQQKAKDLLASAPESQGQAFAQKLASELGIPWSVGLSNENLIKNIKSNFAIDELMKMKQNSPNGASGLGQVTEKEIAMLQDKVQSLDIGDRNFKANVAEVIEMYSRIIENLDKLYDPNFEKGVVSKSSEKPVLSPSVSKYYNTGTSS